MAAERAAGATVRDIATRHGISPGQVSAILGTAEAQEIIKKESSRLFPAAKEIIDNQLMHIRTAGRIHAALSDQGELPRAFQKITRSIKDNGITETVEHDTLSAIKYADTAAKKEENILKAVGILPSHQTNYFTQNIYNDNRSLTLDSNVLKALSTVGVLDVDDIEIETIDE